MEDEEPVAVGWSRVEMRCCLSFAPLIDPARGEACSHVARCNYDELRLHVGRRHACPVFGCSAPLVRPRSVVRDEALKEAMAGADDAQLWRSPDGEYLKRPPDRATEENSLLDLEEDAEDQAATASSSNVAGTASRIRGDRLTLVPSKSNSSGFKGVTYRKGARLPYSASVRVENGEILQLGSFRSKIQAATAYAKYLGPKSSLAAAEQETKDEPPIVSSREVKRRAAAEKLTLVVSKRSQTGYKCVSPTGTSFKAEVHEGSGHKRHLGTCRTAMEAALLYARYLGPLSSAAAAEKEAALDTSPISDAEVQKRAEAQGLTLVPSRRSTGYQGVQFLEGRTSKPYRAQVGSKVGRIKILGYFKTAAEAALCYARHLGPAKSASAATGREPAVTVSDANALKKAHKLAAKEGLTLIMSQQNKTGYLKVTKMTNGTVKPFKATVNVGKASRKRKVELGPFDTAPEAALAYSRFLGKARQGARPQLCKKAAQL